MGLWPGARRTLPRALGTPIVAVGARLELMRCCEFAGGPLLGRGAVDGTRSAAAGLAGVAKAGRAGGGIMFNVPFRVTLGASFGERAAFKACWCLSTPGKSGAGGFGRRGCFDSSGVLPFRDRLGTVIFGSTAAALGVVSVSTGSVTSIRTPLTWSLSSSLSSSMDVDIAGTGVPFCWTSLPRRLPGRSHRVMGSSCAGGCLYAKNEIEKIKTAILQYAISNWCA